MAAPTWEVAAFFLSLGLVGLGVAAWNLRPAYRILRDDPVPVRELPTREGVVEVRGTARPDDGTGVEAPFSGTACLAYEYEVQERQSTGQGSSWTTLDEGSAAVPFLLEDASGRVQVDPRGASLQLSPDTLQVDGGEEPPPRIAEYIRETDAVDPQTGSVDLVVTELNYGNDQRFIERRLHAGETARVYGSVGPAAAGEWGSGLVDAEIADAGDGRPFVISDTSERGTAWRIGKWWGALAVGGVLALLVGLWALGGVLAAAM